jgi:hypothetical protein
MKTELEQRIKSMDDNPTSLALLKSFNQSDLELVGHAIVLGLSDALLRQESLEVFVHPKV